VGRHRFEPPKDLKDWSRTLRQRFLRQNRELGIQSEHAFEVFTVTAWGEIPTLEQLVKDFPPICSDFSHLRKLEQRLAKWRGES
jgi:hypothetical protein